MTSNDVVKVMETNVAAFVYHMMQELIEMGSSHTFEYSVHYIERKTSGDVKSN